MTALRDIAVLALGFALLVAQATLAALVHVHPFSPDLLLPIAIFLGVSTDPGLVRGAVLSFVLGYVLDLFTGSPMGLFTFLMVAVFLVARGAGLSLVMRGPLFQIALTFVVALLVHALALALPAIFERPFDGPSPEARDLVMATVAPAAATAITAPLVFFLVRRTFALFVRRGGERQPTEGAPE